MQVGARRLTAALPLGYCIGRVTGTFSRGAGVVERVAARHGPARAQSRWLRHAAPSLRSRRLRPGRVAVRAGIHTLACTARLSLPLQPPPTRGSSLQENTRARTHAR
jgi:hypothetical protein